MMAAPEVFPEIGDPRTESTLPKLPLLPVDAAALPREPGNPFALVVEPNDPARALYAIYFAQVTLDFLFMHEYQHVAGGHLEFLARDRQSMSEIEPETGIRDWMTSHVLELEAGAAAANFSLNFVYARAPSIHPVLAPFLKTEKALCLAWLFAVHTLFLVMNEASDRAFLAGRLPPTTHPAAVFKRVTMANLVFARRGPFEDVDLAFGAGMEMLMSAHESLARVVDGREQFMIGIDLFGEDEGHAQLAGRWKKMRPRLQALAAANGTEAIPSELIKMFNQGWQRPAPLPGGDPSSDAQIPKPRGLGGIPVAQVPENLRPEPEIGFRIGEILRQRD
jgi:hypothetical protein